MGERRRAKRCSISQLIELGFGKERWVRVRGVDISRGGFRAIVDKDIALGTTMFVLFRIHDDDLQVEAITVHMQQLEDDEGYAAGFEFTRMAPSARGKIDAYVESITEGCV